MKIKFLKFLWVILIVPSLYGMKNLAPNNNKRQYIHSEIKAEDQEPNSKKAKIDQNSEELRYGLVTKSLDDYPDLINVVKQILKIGVATKENAEFLIMKMFRQFLYQRQDIKKIEYEYRPTNFVVYDGIVYSSGGLNITQFFNNVRLLDDNNECLREYPVKQLCDIIMEKADIGRVRAARNIEIIFPILWKILTTFQPDLNDEVRCFIRAFWNKAKYTETNEKITEILDESRDDYLTYIQDALYDWDQNDLLIMEREFINALHTLGIDTSTLAEDEEGLLEAFEKSRDAVREQIDKFLKKFREYITELKPKEGKLFEENILSEIKSLDTKDYLDAVRNLWLNSEYRKYTHTEYLVQYQRKKDGLEEKPLYMISFLDPCTDFCEEMLAKATSNIGDNKNTIVISGRPFKDSRSPVVNHKRENSGLVNRCFLQIQLDMESFWKDRNIFLYQNDQSNQSEDEFESD